MAIRYLVQGKLLLNSYPKCPKADAKKVHRELTYSNISSLAALRYSIPFDSPLSGLARFDKLTADMASPLCGEANGP